MAKRFTENGIWKNQRWFKRLAPEYKLAFCYIKDLCDHAGVWQVDVFQLMDDIGLDNFKFFDFINHVNKDYDKITGHSIERERLILIDNAVLWITGFIQFQYEGKDGKVNPEAPPVRTALATLEGYHTPLGTLKEPLREGTTLFEYALFAKHVTLTHPLREDWQRPKDKDKEKVKDKAKNN